ncbi:hypothetical protein PRIPAC_74254 [Pristionchus pacificus]|nr:hypothetical protein PRIPAC_74254 [Pristionchus pacificus]
MSQPPRYAFITLEPGLSARDLFVDLSQYGDVKLLSRVSDVSSLFTDLVREMETSAGGPKTIYM